MTTHRATEIWNEMLRGTRFVGSESVLRGAFVYTAMDVDSDDSSTFIIPLGRLKDGRKVRRIMRRNLERVL